MLIFILENANPCSVRNMQYLKKHTNIYKIPGTIFTLDENTSAQRIMYVVYIITELWMWY